MMERRLGLARPNDLGGLARRGGEDQEVAGRVEEMKVVENV